MAKRFSVTVKKEWCKSCGLCISICPKKVLAFDDRMKAHPERMDDCIGCRQCELFCPDLAITVEERE